MKRIVAVIILFLLTAACASTEDESQLRVDATEPANPSSILTSLLPSLTPSLALSPTPAGTNVHLLSSGSRSSTATATLAPDAWKTWPILPTGVSPKMCQVYKLGQMLGNDPRGFSKVGDCQSTMPNYLAIFDTGNYDLGPYSDLQPVIDYFHGSFGRGSMAVKIGMTASGVLSPLWSNWRECGANETPLDCEYRLHRPSFAIISLGTNDASGQVPFRISLRRVIDTTIGHGVVPILVTKADDVEGDNSINATIVSLAHEYELPLWNFWLAVQSLPEHGLRSPEHLTIGEYNSPGNFSQPEYMQYAFNVRNLDALQVLAVMMNGCDSQP